jgi:hypothetical protein
MHAHNFHLIAHPFNISYILASFQDSKSAAQGDMGNAACSPRQTIDNRPSRSSKKAPCPRGDDSR